MTFVDDLAGEFGTQLVPETQLGVGLELSTLEDSTDDSSKSISSQSSTKTIEINVEPRREGRATRPTRDLAQLSREAAEARANKDKERAEANGNGNAKGKGKGRRRKLRKSIPTSQLLDEFGAV
jgi:hypothetical protein